MTEISQAELQQLQRLAVQCELIESGHWRDYESDQLNDPLVAELKLLDVALDGKVLTKRWLNVWLPFLASGVLTRVIDVCTDQEAQS